MMLRLLALLLVTPVLAVAAPLPKTPPSPNPKTTAEAILGTIKQEANGSLMFHYMGIRSRASVVQEVVTNIVDGKEVTSTVNVTRVTPEPYQIKLTLNVKTSRVTDTKGEVISEDDLKKRIEKDLTVVRLVAPIDAEWRKFFADDVLFLEPSTISIPRAGVIAPLQIRPAIPLAPPIPPPAPPIIK